MKSSVHNQTLALAGLMHSTWLVRQLAREGHIPEDQLEEALQPIFALNPDAIDDVYPSGNWRDAALTVLEGQLGAARTSRDLETTRYAATLMHVERKLVRRDELMATLREGIEASARQLAHFAVTHRSVVGGLGDLYSRTISTLRPRVMVQGHARYLEDTATADRVRALLLAGVRSAVLWRQCGGTRLNLVFGRGRLIRTARALKTEDPA